MTSVATLELDITTSDEKRTEDSPTSALPACFAEERETHTGYAEMHLQGLSLVNSTTSPEAKEDLEELFRSVYNNVSGMCLDPLERTLTLESVNLIVSQDASWDAGTTVTHWTADVTCNGCPAYEPLFESSETAEERRRLDERGRTFELSSEFLPLFAATFGYHMSLRLASINDEKSSRVTYAASRSYAGPSDTSGDPYEKDAFTTVQVIGDTVVRTYDSYVASLNGRVQAPFTNQRINDIQDCLTLDGDDGSISLNVTTTSPIC